MTSRKNSSSALPPRGSGFVYGLGVVAFLCLCLSIATLIFVFNPNNDGQTWVSILVIVLLTFIVGGLSWLNRVPSLDRTLMPVIGALYSGITITLYLLISAYFLSKAEPVKWNELSLHEYLWTMFWVALIVAALTNGLVALHKIRIFAYLLASCAVLFLVGLYVKYMILGIKPHKDLVTSEVITFAVGAGLFVVLYLGVQQAEDE